MSQPVLSVCIPTRERRRYLESALRSLLAPGLFPFEIEIVVSDNAGNDDTRALAEGLIGAGAPLRYFRHERDIGVVNNMYSAFRRARGEFMVYLADDDRLIPDGIARTVSWLRTNPKAVAVYAPWETYDAVEDKAQSVSFVIDPGGAEFGPGDRLAILDLLLQHGILPEVPMLRASAVGSAMYGSSHIYWCFPAIDRLLDIGTIRFSALPYYRSVVRHFAGEARSTVTQRNTLAQWDTYRRGFEYLFWRARQEQALSPEREADFAGRIAAQGRYYLGYAFRSRLETGDYKGAADIAMIMSAEGVPPPGGTEGTVALCAAADRILDVLDLLDELQGVAVLGFPDAAGLLGVLHSLRPGLVVETIDDPGEARFQSTFLVVTGTTAQRDLLIAAGYLPGCVIDFTHLLGQMTVAPPG